MLKLSVGLFLIGLALNASAKPWHHESPNVEGRTSKLTFETKSLNINDGDDGDNYNRVEENQRAYEVLKNLIIETVEQRFHTRIMKIIDEHPVPDFTDKAAVWESYKKLSGDIEEYMTSIGLTPDEEEGVTTTEATAAPIVTSTAVPDGGNGDKGEESEADKRKKELYRYVYKSLTQDLIKSADPKIRDKVEEIVKNHPEPDFLNESQVEEAYQQILEKVNAYKKSLGIETSSEEVEGSDEEEEDLKTKLNKYVYKSLTQDLIDSADPEIRDKIEEIVKNHPDPDFSDGEKVEEAYQEVLKKVKAFTKSSGIETSSEEEDSESVEEGTSTTAAPNNEDDDSDYESGSEEEDSDESDSDKTKLNKYVYESLTQELIDSADEEIRDKIEEIVKNHPEPDFSDGKKVEEAYKEIVKKVKAYKKSLGIATSSEEVEEGSAEGGSTAAPIPGEPDNSDSGSEEDVVTVAPEVESEESDEDESSSDKTKLYKYVYESLTQQLIDSADEDIRDKVEEIVKNHPEPDFSDAEEVEEAYQEILKKVKAYKKSLGIKTSSEEEDSESAEGGVTSSTVGPTQGDDESNESDSEEDVVTVAPEAQPEDESNEDESGSDESKTKLYKYVYESLTQDLIKNADPEIRDKVEEIVKNHPEPDFSDAEEVDEAFKEIVKKVKAYKKSLGIQTSSEEDNSVSAEGGDSSPKDSTINPGQEGSEKDRVSTAKPIEIPEDDNYSEEPDSSENEIESDEDESTDPKKDLYKYVFKSLTEDLISNSDPAIRRKVKEIIKKHPKPDYSDEQAVEQAYKEILEEVEQYKKSEGIVSSSEEDSSFNEV